MFTDNNVPDGPSANLRPENYDYNATSKRLIKSLGLNSKLVVADIGCGNGLLAEHLLSNCKELTLIEGHPNLVKYLMNKFKENKKVKTYYGVCPSLKFIESNTFDRVICSAVFQYLSQEEARATIKEFVRICKPDGLIYVADVFDSAVIHDDRDGMSSFDPEFLCGDFKYRTVGSNYEPEKRYDLLIQK
jgi:ubiquinone/menaquinone biosynthesis C-methylase UbiE